MPALPCRRWLPVLATVLTLVILIPLRAQNPKQFERWEKAIGVFEKQDQLQAPPKNAILFVGSSSIVRWDLKKSFPDLVTINRGFGGSQLADSVHFAPRIILKHEPRIVVLYAGDNDIAAGKSPEQVARDFEEFIKVLRAKLPNVKIVFLSVKPSPSRLKHLERQKKANQLVEDMCKKGKDLVYVDLVNPMLDARGQPRPELFAKDLLHLNEEGYRLWNKIVRAQLK